MKIEVRAMAGIERADLEFEKVALIVGPTGAGKTSIADAARAAVTNDWHIRGITAKSRLSGVVHAGYDSASAKIVKGEAFAQIQFPSTEYETGAGTDGALFSHEVAAGLANPLAEDMRKRAQFFIDILAAHPTEKDVMIALEDAGLTRQQGSRVWKRINESNFDDAHKYYATRATELKGQWEGIAKDRWGSRKGENYLPDGWDETLSDASKQSLEKEIADAKQGLEELIADSAVSEERRNQLQEQADRLDNLEKQLKKLKKASAEQHEKTDVAEGSLAELPEPVKTVPTVDCPHCGATSYVDVSSGEFTLLADNPEPVSEDDNKQRIAAQEQAREDLAAHRKALNEAENQVTQCEQLIRTAEAAADQLAGLPPAKEQSETQINAAREAVATATSRMAKFTQKKDADIVHKSILLNLTAVEELKPEGVRRRKLSDALEEFNKTAMTTLNKNIPGYRCFFNIGTLEPMVETPRGVRHYNLLSRGEKLIFESVFQFAVAAKDGSSLVIIDDADAVTGDLRAGLVKMALAAETPSLICMAVKAREQVPDLSKTKKGRTYWVADKTAIAFDERG